MPELSREQWAFMALLYAFNEPVPIDIAGVLAPLLPGPMMDLLEKMEPEGWLQRPAKGMFSVGDQLPKAIRNKLKQINCREHLTGIADRIYQEDLSSQLSREAMLNLLEGAGHCRELAENEISIAHQAVAENDHKKALVFLERAVKRLAAAQNDKNLIPIFITSTLELSNLYFSLGFGFQNTYQYLLQAQEAAIAIGDQRSHALANLHLGRIFYFTGRRDDALIALSMGYDEIKDLGDDDIMGQSAPFLGKYYFIKGQLKEALLHFERAEQAHDSNQNISILTNPPAPLFLGYCAVYLGQFHRAIGSLDYYWRLAEEQGNRALAATMRAILGTVLVILRKDPEAAIHFDAAMQDNSDGEYALAPYFAGGGIALMHYFNGNLEESYKTLKTTIANGSEIGLVRQYSSPWVIEMIYEYHRLGFEPIPGFDFPEIMKRTENGINIHLRGVCLRLKAQEKLAQGGKFDEILKDLQTSEKYLEESGDKTQQAKTIFLMVKLELKKGKRQAARNLVYRARRLLGGYADEIFPKEFQHLIDKKDKNTGDEFRRQGFLHNYLSMIESLYPSDNKHEIMTKVLHSTSSIFGAERSGLFWFQENKNNSPELRAAYNLSRKEVCSEDFRDSMTMIFKTRQTNQPQVNRARTTPGADNNRHPIRSALYIPIEVNHTVQGVLYYDNSYLNDAFDFLDHETMKHMMRHTNTIVERHLNYLKLKEEHNLLVSEKSLQLEDNRSDIISHSKKMKKLLKQVDQIATTDSTVLLTGETGTGKELLSGRIHRKSLRKDGPFITVDSTTIPEKLLESELFGHERGAFTGADKKKIGRIEMAHQGTLFMDEIGELPLEAQAKLLRALQERQFNRVGGTQLISSDFRLVAATNRNLREEVANGNFRKDLYFRLNVIPIHLPPLRDRSLDIPLLANYFLDLYAAKYKRHDLCLADEQKQKLQEYKWPGNIRELQNVMERAVLLSDENQLEIRLPAEIQTQVDNPFADLPSMDEIQRRYINYILQKCGGKIGGAGGAAEILGLKRTSLYSRMKILGMKTNAETIPQPKRKSSARTQGTSAGRK